MRIAVFTETFLPNVNGVVRRLEHTLRHLVQGGDQVLLFAPGGGPSEYQGVEVVSAPAFSLPMYPEIAIGMPRPALRARLDRFRPDVVHAVNPVVLGAGGMVYARWLGVPVVASFHTHIPRYLAHYGLGRFETLAWDALRSIHNQAEINLCISTPIATELGERGIERVAVGWRGGVDADLFHPRRASRAMRERLTEGHPDAPLLIYAGRLGSEKGIETLSAVLPGVPGARLALVGDGPHRPVLERHFRGQPVHFAGYLRGEELAGAVATADVMVFPSETDTLGLVLLESMAAGTPVVASDSGGVRELVAHGRTGLLFPARDAAAAAAGVSRLLADVTTRELIRVAGRRQAEAWTWAAGVADLRGWYLRAQRTSGLTVAA